MTKRYAVRWADSRAQAVPKTFIHPDEALDLARAMARVAKRGLDVVEGGGELFRSIRVGAAGELVESSPDQASAG